MSLKIAYISDERYPSPHTDTQQVMKTMDALGSLGVQVDFIQPRMAGHFMKNPKERKKEICDWYNVSGNFSIRDIPFWPASDLRVEKFFHGLLAPLKSAIGHYDVVYTRNILPLALASAMRQPVLFETYRPLCRTDPSAFRVLKKAAKSRRFLGISTHSEYSRLAMIDAGIDPGIIRAVPNGYDPKDFADLPSYSAARAELGLPQSGKTAVYTGHIRRDKGVHALLDLAQEVPECTMLIVGGSPSDVESLNKDVSARHLANVRLEGQVPIHRVPFYLAAADVLVLPPSALPLMGVGHTVLPIKTFTYIAAGRPILAPDLPDTQGVLTHDKNCLKVIPDNPTDAARGLRALFSSPELADRLAKQAKEDSALFTWNGRAERLVAFIEHRLSQLR